MQNAPKATTAVSLFLKPDLYSKVLHFLHKELLPGIFGLKAIHKISLSDEKVLRGQSCNTGKEDVIKIHPYSLVSYIQVGQKRI